MDLLPSTRTHNRRGGECLTVWGLGVGYWQRRMGRRFPDGGLLRYRKWVPQQLGDVADIQPTNGSAAQQHGSQSQLYSFFGVVDRTLTHFFWSTGWEVISKFPSHSSLSAIVSGSTSVSSNIFQNKLEFRHISWICTSCCAPTLQIDFFDQKILKIKLLMKCFETFPRLLKRISRRS